MKFEEPKYQLNIKIINSLYAEHYNKFEYHHLGDSGIDLYNPQIKVDSFCIGSIDFEIQCEMIDIDTNTYTSYLLVPRSSISKTVFMMANSMGIIDAGYRGNLIAKIKNVSNNEECLNEGSYFQIIAPDLKPIKVKIVDSLSSTTRNDGGFGSTNK